MSFISNILELEPLRKVIRDRQDLFLDHPVVNTYLASLRPPSVVSQMSALIDRFTALNGGAMDPVFLEMHSTTQELMDFTKNLQDSEADLAAFLAGDFDGYVLEMFPLQMDRLVNWAYADYAQYLLFPDPGFLVPLRGQGDYISYFTLSFLEMMDLLGADIEEGGEFSLMMNTIQNSLKTLVPIPFSQPVWDAINARQDYFVARPVLQESINQLVTNSEYMLADSKSQDVYQNGDLVATLRMLRPPLHKAEVTKGAVPTGMELDPETGNILVSNASKLMGGLYGGITIEVTDGVGTVLTHTLTIEIGLESEVEYKVAPPQPVNTYAADFILAWIMTDELPIRVVQPIEGRLPKGVSIDTGAGNIMVVDPTKLRAGTFPLLIRVEDEAGGETLHEITLVIGPEASVSATPVGPPPVIYAMETAKSCEQYALYEVLGRPDAGETYVEFATISDGSLPSGVCLNTENGELFVCDTTQLSAGPFSFQIRTTTATGVWTYHDLSLDFGPCAAGDQEAVYTVNGAKAINDYVQGEVIATVADPDGDIVASSLVSGTLPAGVDLDVVLGALKISDPALLTDGTTVLGIKTTDISGNFTISQVTLQFLPSGAESTGCISLYGNIYLNFYGSPQAVLTIGLDEGGGITISDLESVSTLPSDGVYYTGTAYRVSVKPGGEGDQTGLSNSAGDIYTLISANHYELVGTEMDVTVLNNQLDATGKPVGTWIIAFGSDCVTVSENP